MPPTAATAPEHQSTGAEVMPPGHPQSRQHQERREVEVELAGPGELGHVAEEDRHQAGAVAGEGDRCVAGDGDQTGGEKHAEQGHVNPSRGGAGQFVVTATKRRCSCHYKQGPPSTAAGGASVASMSARFEELGWQQTPMGEISLRRRFDPSLRVDVYEVKLGDEHVMSSLFTVAEKELARLGLARTPGTALDVIVGGLGLGYTAQEALQCSRIRTLTVIEYSEAVLDWHERDLLPDTAGLAADSRVRLVHGDFFAAATDAVGFDPDSPGRTYDAILLDIDHSPRHLLHDPHARFYTHDGLQSPPPSSPRVAHSPCGPTIPRTTTSRAAGRRVHQCRGADGLVRQSPHPRAVSRHDLPRDPTEVQRRDPAPTSRPQVIQSCRGRPIAPARAEAARSWIPCRCVARAWICGRW